MGTHFYLAYARLRALACGTFAALVLVGLTTTPSSAAPAPKLLQIAEFKPFRSPENPELQKRILTELRTAFTSKGYRVEQAGAGSLAAQTSAAKARGASFLIVGYYTKTPSDINTSIYAQVINPETGFLIDALNVSDQIEEISGIELDPNELRESDEKRVRRFASRIVVSIRSNPNRIERRQNIDTYVTGTKLAQAVAFPIRTVTKKERGKEVFQLLEDQVVVTASRAKTRLREAPAAVYVITSRQIAERGYRTLVEALHDVPGFDIIHVYGIFPELIHQRGLVGNNQRTLLYVDGILDNNLTENAVLGGSLRFPLHNVERIEVVSGPASAVYGANAFNGVINIITKDGQQHPGGHAGVTYGSYESNFRNRGASGRVAIRGSTEDKFSYSASAYYYQTEGPSFANIGRLEKPIKTSADAIERRNDALYALESELCGGQCADDGTSRGYYWSPRFNVAYEDTYNITAALRSGGFRFQTIHWQFLQGDGSFANGTQQLDVKSRGLETGKFDARNSARLLGVLAGVASTKGFLGSYWNFRNNSALLGYDFDISKNLRSESEAIVRHTELLTSSGEEYPNQVGRTAYLRPGDTTTAQDYGRPDYSYEFEQRLNWKISRAYTLIAGTEWIYTSIPEGYGARQRISFVNYALYAENVYRFQDDTIFTLGYRFDQNTDYGDSHTPRLSVVLNPTRSLTVKLLAASGFRAPTGWELFNETLQRRANRDLRPERQRTAEVGVAWRIARPYYVSAQFFYNAISNLLLEVETTEANPNVPGSNFNQNQNVGRAVIKGAETQADVQLSKRWSLFAHYTYTEGAFTELPDPVTLSASPSTTGRLGEDPLRDASITLYKSVRATQPALVEFLESQTGSEFSPYEGPMPNVARHKGGIGTVFRPVDRLSLHLRVNVVGIRRTIATNPEPTTPGYYFWSGNLRWENPYLDGFVLELLVRNLTNDLLFDPGIRTANGGYYPTRHPLEKRNVWLSIAYKW